MKQLFLTLAALWLLAPPAAAQPTPPPDSTAKKPDPPAFNLLRARERYDYLLDPATSPYQPDFLDPIKYVPLNAARTNYLTLGGQIRVRYEQFNNRFFRSGSEGYYLQRLSLHAALRLTPYVRVFGELYHGYLSAAQPEVTESDQLDVHQAFVELHAPLAHDGELSLTTGRQELAFGVSRLVGLREGPNIRRSFDAVRGQVRVGATSVQAFYGVEVQSRFGVFDNGVTLFERPVPAPQLWGIYSQFKIPGVGGQNELYYLGFRSQFSRYDNAAGPETRHTFGLRRFGMMGTVWRYNTELVVQTGTVGTQPATGWALETDWHYLLNHARLNPEIGARLNLVSGDQHADDGRLQTFNTLFTNPAYYSLAATLVPVNLMELSPSFSFKPTPAMSVMLEWALFYRYSTADGIYMPPRLLLRSGQGTNARFIGHQPSLTYTYNISHHLGAGLLASYFITGPFIAATGETGNLLYVAPTLSFTF